MVKLPEPGNNVVFPPGPYKVKIVSYELGKAKTGTPQIQWKAEVIEPEAHKGRMFSEYTALTEKAVWKVSNLIGGCGVTFDPNAIDTDSASFTTLCNQCVGRTSYWLNAEGEDNKGNVRNNIVKFEADTEQEETSFQVEDDSPFAPGTEAVSEDQVEWPEEEG